METFIYQLHRKVARWEEEVRVFGDGTELTAEDVAYLNAKTNKLVIKFRALKLEAKRLLEIGRQPNPNQVEKPFERGEHAP